MTTKTKKVGLAAVLAVVVVATVLLVDSRVRDNSMQHFTQQFSLLGSLRKSALEAYLATIRAEVTFWSVSESLKDSADRLQRGWDALPDERSAILQGHFFGTDRDDESIAASGYAAAHASLHDLATEFLVARGYYDLFLVDAAGNIIYTVEKESDFATNLFAGPYRDTGLADVVRRAVDSDAEAVHFSDLEKYAPSNDAPAIFAARRMTDANGQTSGVLAVQLPTSRIVDIMQFDAGMGESGETYLVGQDYLMRSDSRFSAESTILATRVDTETVALALDGRQGVAFTDDYRGVPVLSAYDSLEIDGYRWAVMAEIDEAEVRQQTAGIGGVLAALGAVFYGLALWTITVVARFVSPGGAGDGGDHGVDLDVA